MVLVKKIIFFLCLDRKLRRFYKVGMILDFEKDKDFINISFREVFKESLEWKELKISYKD